MLAALVLTLAACGGRDDERPSSPEPISAGRATSAATVGGEPPPFVNDADLERHLQPDVLALPLRFQLVERSDREPILVLGQVSGAARVTYRGAATNEVLSVDLLRLQDGVDAVAFFDAFADGLVENTNFRGARAIGVPHGIGERARHYTLSVEGDDAETAALLRNGVIALVTYRRPADFRQPLEVSALLRLVDTALQVG